MTNDVEHYDTVVVGGGQAGLTAGYYLRASGRPFAILDAHPRVGDAWRTRWASLRLFTPARFDALPGLPFPSPPWSFPTKDELADYLEGYAEHFDLPVRTGVEVERLEKVGDRFVVTAGDHRFEADNVIVATGAHRIPKLPAFASELDPRIVQLHSADYRDPSQLQPGDVLVVGAGNSGAEIARDLASAHTVRLAGPSTGEIPVPHGSRRARIAFRVVRFLGHRVLRVDTRIGRKLGPKLTSKGDPLIRTKSKDLAAAGVERLRARVTDVRDGLPVLDDGRALDVANVVWCTGFRTDFGWIDLDVFDENGSPLHGRGVVEAEPGLYFLGLVLLYSVSSDVLPNAGRDAGHIVKHVERRRAEHAATEGRPAIATA